MPQSDHDLPSKVEALESENQALQSRLQEAEEALRAISTGEVDALVVYGSEGERIYTLQGADYAYRVMVESIHEGAANITADGTLLYCNKRLAEMLDRPLENVLGSSIYSYLMPEERETFATLSAMGIESFGRFEFNLSCGQGKPLPVLITASAAEVDGHRGICVVVTDLSEQKQAAERERELQMRLMGQREEERVRIARNLHDGPLQDLLGISYILQDIITNQEEDQPEGLPEVEVDGDGSDLPQDENPLHEIRAGILKLAADLRNVCNELRPPNTIRFGLAKAIRYHIQEIHTKHPALTIQLDLEDDSQSIPKEISTALFRIYQESINNVLRHAEASSLLIRLQLSQKEVRLEIQDNGKGFKPPVDWVDIAREGHLGLVGMRERAEAFGGKLKVITAEQQGATILVRIPIKEQD